MPVVDLYEILDNAHDGEAVIALGRQFGLTPAQMKAAVTALLPAISTGLKQSTATVDGLAKLFGVMGQQEDLQDMYDDPQAAFGSEGVAAGNDALSVIFGSPDVSRAVIDQAQKFSGVDSNTLKKLLPVLAGILVSGLTRSGSTGTPASPSQPSSSGGNLGDILGQIFGRAMQGSPGTSAGRAPQAPKQPSPLPTDTSGQAAPGGDLLGTILREMEKGIREGRIKPVIIGGGPVQIPLPSGQEDQTPPSPGGQQMPGGDIFGQILRDVLGGAISRSGPTPQRPPAPSPPMKDLSDLSKTLGVMGGAGTVVFGDHFEVGQDVDKSHVANIQSVFERFMSAQRR
jgi:hypothetical protein